jgi:hypothetical protein
METDPVEEIRERRRMLIRDRYHGSVEALIDEAIRWEKAHPKRTVSRRRRKLAEPVL